MAMKGALPVLTSVVWFDSDISAVMGAYNKFRGTFCCQDDFLLNTVLKGEWGFNGVVVSDWNGTHDTREAVLG